ncbi:hypothetical protein M378DRAFT_155156 [Amanita muscaria Koide BX008]|uniref:Uncharacterized protein n=1 Tax=Amanita muscaria (strain Koide BX008) TaxID=946122 RepID=A0A0C2XPP6_AMAMK|nr:hypothetical protein M378DRAFT_155156 [Amanita muscaria Koide BX008]
MIEAITVITYMSYIYSSEVLTSSNRAKIFIGSGCSENRLRGSWLRKYVGRKRLFMRNDSCYVLKELWYYFVGLSM